MHIGSKGEKGDIGPPGGSSPVTERPTVPERINLQ